MPNWCSNALEISLGTEEERFHVESLFDGKFINRTDEITSKLRKILLAGIGGVLHPSKDVTHDVLDAAVKLHSGLSTSIRCSDERSQAYTQFLNTLVNGSISPSNYEELDDLYKRTGLDKLWWGDISKEKRNKIRAVWKRCHYDFSGGFDTDISSWWSKADLYKNTSEAKVLDMRVLVPLRANVLVNGLNGKLLNCFSTHVWYRENLGTTCPVFKVYPSDNGNYIFSTPWKPATPVIDMIPSFLANATGKHEDDLCTSCTLYYYEPGCAFQGINEETEELTFAFNEETGEYEEELFPEIREAFGYC